MMLPVQSDIANGSWYPRPSMPLCSFFALQPMRCCVLGPPAVGKTCIVAALCKHYKLHHIKIKDVIDEAVEALVSRP